MKASDWVIFATVKCHVAEQCLAHLGVREATDLIGLVSVSGGGGGVNSHRLALCQLRSKVMQI